MLPNRKLLMRKTHFEMCFLFFAFTEAENDSNYMKVVFSSRKCSEFNSAPFQWFIMNPWLFKITYQDLCTL